VNQATLPVNQATFPMNQATFPVNQASFPVNQATLPVNQATFPVNQAAFPVNQATFPMNQAAFPVNLAALPVNRAAVPVNRAWPAESGLSASSRYSQAFETAPVSSSMSNALLLRSLTKSPERAVGADEDPVATECGRAKNEFLGFLLQRELDLTKHCALRIGDVHDLHEALFIDGN